MSNFQELGERMYGAAPASTPAAGQPAQPAQAAPAAAPVVAGQVTPVSAPRTQAELGAALYGPNGSIKPEKTYAEARPTDGEQSEGRTTEELAEALYGGKVDLPAPESPVDLDILELRNDSAYRFYRGDIESMIKVEDAEKELTGKMDKPAIHQLVADVRAMCSDLSLSKTEMLEFRESLQRGASYRDDQTGAAKAMQEEFGQQADLAIRAARALVSKVPKLQRILNSSGAGNDPKLAVMIGRKALTMYKGGKLNLQARRK